MFVILMNWSEIQLFKKCNGSKKCSRYVTRQIEMIFRGFFTLRHLHVLFDLVKVKKKEEIDGPARKYEDYEVIID